jgi:hypothetical protein
MFKLEYDWQIVGLIEDVEFGPDFPPLPATTSQKPPRFYAMADNATIFTKLERESLARICDILTDFHLLSGLTCNMEKTTLIQFGVDAPIPPDDIVELGFEIQNEIKLLELKRKSNCSNYVISKKELEDSVDSQIRFWRRFNFLLTGRISVSKTFMYSQLNYIGCFLPIKMDRLNSIENKIEAFVKGPLNISKERMTLSRE